MKPGQKILVLRYGNNIISDCIEKHQEVIKEYGYCWFGKIGTSPSTKIINALLAEDEPEIILYKKGKAHMCRLEEISDKKPDKGYPDYYQEYLYDQLIFPKVYFKLTSIEEIELKELDKCIVCSSLSHLMDTLNRSMSSFIFAMVPDPNAKAINVKEQTKGEKTKPTRKKKDLLDKNDCVYRKDGKCSNRSCISYQYECEHPSVCIKQKR